MTPKRLGVKFYISNPDAVELDAIIPIFQRWIQQQTVENMLIDVADYKHVPEGPGILLIAHEGDYSVDMAHGKPSLLYTYKIVAEDNVAAAVATAARRALTAINALLAEETITLEFDLKSAEISFIDRLNYPNTEDTLSKVQESLSGLIYDNDAVEVVAYDKREPFTVRVGQEALVDLDSLIERLTEKQSA